MNAFAHGLAGGSPQPSLSILGTAVALPRWLHYRTSEGSPAAVVIRARCLAGEDTAAHLKLIDYSSARIVYGCYRKGF